MDGPFVDTSGRSAISSAVSNPIEDDDKLGIRSSGAQQYF